MSHDSPNEKPLQGWKEIAAYLERDVRTAVRWEKRNGLPVRRHGVAKGSSVYAYPSEIEDWRTGRAAEPGAVLEPPHWRRPTTWASFGLALVAGLVVAYGPILNPRSPIAEAAEGSMRAEQLWTGDDADLHSRLSPDGKAISFVDWSTGDLMVRDLGSGAVRRLTAKGGWDVNGSSESFAQSSAISPDGKRVAYAWFHYDDSIPNDQAGFQLRVGSVVEGPDSHNPEILFRGPTQRGFVETLGWLSNSRILFLHADEERNMRFVIADADTGRITPLKTVGWSYPEGVAISPDGRWIAYGLKPDAFAKQHDIRILASDGSLEDTVIKHPANEVPVAWTPTGSHLLYRSDRTGNAALWALPVIDRQTGPPVLVNPEFSMEMGVGLSPQGDLYYVKRTGTLDIYIAELDLAARRLVSQPRPVATTYVGDSRRPAFSPDGKLLAYLSNRSMRSYGDRRVVVRDLASGAERDLDPKLSSVGETVWARDSQSILMRAADRKAKNWVYRAPVDGGPAEQVFQPVGVLPANYGTVPGGNLMHYRESNGPSGAHRIRDLKTDEERSVVLPDGDSWLSVSPDGSSFAVVDRYRTKDVTILSVLDARTLEERELFRVARPEWIKWSTQWTNDGRNILFWINKDWSGATRRNELWVQPTEGGQPWYTGLAVERLGGRGDFSLHPDGRRLAYAAGSAEYEIWKLSNFLERLSASD